MLQLGPCHTVPPFEYIMLSYTSHCRTLCASCATQHAYHCQLTPPIDPLGAAHRTPAQTTRTRIVKVDPSASDVQCKLHTPQGHTMLWSAGEQTTAGTRAHGRVEVGQVRLVGAIPLYEADHNAIVEGAPCIPAGKPASSAKLYIAAS